MRIGIGYDVHSLVSGRPLIIGGVVIPFEKGLAGHSDADVLSHAIVDAILGAAGLGDIGTMFPDSEAKWKDCSSLFFLQAVREKIAADFTIINIDSIIIAEQPKFRPFIPRMAEQIAHALSITTDCVSIKATTTEKLGSIGRGQGIAAQAVVLLGHKGTQENQ